MSPTSSSPSAAGSDHAHVTGGSLSVGGLIAALLALAWAYGAYALLLLACIGTFAGFALYHASFGFTAAWRRFIIERKSAGLRAQIIMLGLASLFFFPVLAQGSFFGQPTGGFVFPIGIALVLGAFLFGIGMQIGGGCGSGTLFTIGGGSVRMVVTLAFFIFGSTIATAYSSHWLAWPAFPAVSILYLFGWLPALVTMLLVLSAAYFTFTSMEFARHGATVPVLKGENRSWLKGPWSLMAGAIALAAINSATLAISGWPWGITSAFALWGSKIASAIGMDVAQWTYWRGQEATLTAPIFTDTTSIMDFGIILGAMLAALLAGKFNPSLKIPPRSLLAAMIGGILLGIGARLGTGCNIGAFFSGTVSGSLHGWVWLIAAFAGNVIGVRLRPAFRLD